MDHPAWIMIRALRVHNGLMYFESEGYLTGAGVKLQFFGRPMAPPWERAHSADVANIVERLTLNGGPEDVSRNFYVTLTSCPPGEKAIGIIVS